MNARTAFLLAGIGLLIAGIVSGWFDTLFPRPRGFRAKQQPAAAHPGRIPYSYDQGRHLADRYRPDASDEIRLAIQDDFRSRVARRVRIRIARRIVARKRSRDDERGYGREY